jgi:glutaconyl-CoA/methylmalonyl-CoA decarboxylase subunit delta
MLELLTRLADPTTIQSLSLGDKLLAGLAATLLGMGITFAALILLQLTISCLARILNRPPPPRPVPPLAAAPPTPPAAELVAVITAVIASQLQTTPERIVIKNLEACHGKQPRWSRAGIIDQMNSRL